MLASELLAIRLLVPFAGSGVEVVAIVISAVLLPLAAGYHVGGMRYQKLLSESKRLSAHPPSPDKAAGGRVAAAAALPGAVSIRRLLLRNLLSALVILVCTLSYFFIHLLFAVMEVLGITHTLLQAAIYSVCFLVYPVYLLAQTVPLVMHYFSRGEISRVAGRLLFISTVGSFLGSVFATIVLMNTVGVHLTAVITIGLLTLAVFLLSGWRRRWFDKLIALLALGAMVFLNSPDMMARFNIVAQNAYNTVMITADEHAREMWLNHSRSAKFSADPNQRYPYIRFIEQAALDNLPPGKSVLVIGAGGFGLGWENTDNPFTFVDIDPDLKELAEKHLLPGALHDNKRFVAQSARAFLEHTDKRFDVIIVDVYTNEYAIPMETTTREFWQSIDAHLNHDGILIANIIGHASFRDRFSGRIANTFDHVFPHHFRQVLQPVDLWAPQDPLVNILFVHKKNNHSDDRTIYTDDLTTHSLDRYR